MGLITGHFKELMMLLFIVFVHEMGHAVMAHFFHWRIKQIQLLPFGGVVEVDEHGNRPLREELLVTIAGPAMHVILIAVSFGLYQLTFLKPETMELFFLHNMMILAFNLLPVWPLDGGKLLFVALSTKLSFSKAHKISLLISFSFLICTAIIFLFFAPFHLNFWLVFTFLLVSQYGEWKQRQYTHMRFLLERYYGKHRDIPKLTSIVATEKELLYDVILRFSRGCKHNIIVQGSRVAVDENELLHAYFAEKKTTSTIGEVFGI